jgi:hypothetical protein
MGTEMKRTQSLRRIASKVLAGAVVLLVPVVVLALFAGTSLALFTTQGEPVAKIRLLDMTAGEQTAPVTAKPAADAADDAEVQIAHWENTAGPKKLSGNQ